MAARGRAARAARDDAPVPRPVVAPRERGLFAPLLGLGLAIALVWAAAVALAGADRNPILVYNGAFAIAFFLYLGAAALVLRRLSGEAVGAAGHRLLMLILGLALLPRAILLLSDPALSDDLYRYIWDGKVAAAGIDPYRYAPDAPELAPLRDALWTPINQKSQHTPYPPAAQAVFAATYRIAPDSIKAQQVVATAGDVLAIGALLALLGRLGLPRERVLLYAWSPTPALHFAHSAHNDSLMIAATLLAPALALVPDQGGGGRLARAGSGLALALAALIKLIPLLLGPLLLRRWRWAGLLACGAGLALGVAPYLASGPAALAGLGTEAGEAVFNDSLHLVLVRLLAPLTPRAATLTTLLSAATLALAALASAWRGGREPAGLARGAATLLGLALLLNAVVEPWYLAWILPFVALFLRPGRGRWPFAPTPLLGWLWLSGAVQLTDLTYLGPEYARWWPIIRAIEYGPLFALLARDALRHARLAVERYRARLAGAR